MSWFPALQAEHVQNVLTAAIQCATARYSAGGLFGNVETKVVLQSCVGCATEGRSTVDGLWPPICTEGLAQERHAGTRYHNSPR